MAHIHKHLYIHAGRRGAYAAAILRGSMVLFGGARCEGACTCHNDVWEYVLPRTTTAEGRRGNHAATWMRVTDVATGGDRVPAARYKHSFATPVYRSVGATAVDGDNMIKVGGDGARVDGGATAVEGMFVFGGEGYRFAQDYHKDLWFLRSVEGVKQRKSESEL